MNKYQIKFLSEIILGVAGDEGKAKVKVDDDGRIVITQNRNYTITDYVLKLRNVDISGVSYYVNAWKNVNVNSAEIQIPIDFNNPTTIVKISLKDGLVDDFEAKVQLIFADKGAWDRKQFEAAQEERKRNIRAKLGSAGSLHSLIFSPCCKQYAYSVVKWYAISLTHRGLTVRTEQVGKILLEETKVEKKFHCNIETAFDVGYSLTQYDAQGNELITVSEGV